MFGVSRSLTLCYNPYLNRKSRVEVGVERSNLDYPEIGDRDFKEISKGWKNPPYITSENGKSKSDHLEDEED